MPHPSHRRPRILLTGPTGQVGWELSRSLQALGDVIAIGRAPCNPARQQGDAGAGAAPGKLRLLGASQGTEVPYYEHARDKHAHDEHADLTLDLASPDSIRAAVRRVQPDLIVNAAAYTAVDKAESEPELAMAVNGIAPGVLAEEARRVGAALVHYSTDYVFDGTGETPWCEDDATGPQNTYGRTKLVGEEAIQAAGAPHLILRVSWVYGLHGSNFVKTMLRLGMQRPALSVVDDQWGAPTSARVIADITGQILVQGRGDWPGFLRERGGVVHLVCQGQTNWHRFAQKIFELAGAQGVPLAVKSLSPIPSSQYPTPARRPANSRMSCQRLWERFGLAPPSWQVALEQSFPLPSLPPQVERKAA